MEKKGWVGVGAQASACETVVGLVVWPLGWWDFVQSQSLIPEAGFAMRAVHREENELLEV